MTAAQELQYLYMKAIYAQGFVTATG